MDSSPTQPDILVSLEKSLALANVKIENLTHIINIQNKALRRISELQDDLFGDDSDILYEARSIAENAIIECGKY